MDELTREFLIESQEGLDRMEGYLPELEKSPRDGGVLAEIFRSVHTIKGTTGFLGYKRLEKTLERNLISAERAAEQSERELLQLVFLPGFSTTSAISRISGRGVGLDVVRTNGEKIGGKIELDSHPGKGTALRLRIPLTLAIVPASILRSVGQSFALP